MKTVFRVIDTGSLSAAENMALDEAMLEARAEDLIPDTIRFLSFRPHTALVGQFQTVEKEIRKDYCRENGIDINRRITGGGALYWGTSDIGWEIFSAREGQFGVFRVEDYSKPRSISMTMTQWEAPIALHCSSDTFNGSLIPSIFAIASMYGRMLALK